MRNAVIIGYDYPWITILSLQGVPKKKKKRIQIKYVKLQNVLIWIIRESILVIMKQSNKTFIRVP